ncbi:hypothetical protein GGR57DRAFT_363958 [Xylariaceae sp. FL1272]|nr:hypothetical protein GGR57DRAFT_363958 [Xylariaceae sp. FL1272]
MIWHVIFDPYVDLSNHICGFDPITLVFLYFLSRLAYICTVHIANKKLKRNTYVVIHNSIQHSSIHFILYPVVSCLFIVFPCFHVGRSALH